MKISLPLVGSAATERWGLARIKTGRLLLLLALLAGGLGIGYVGYGQWALSQAPTPVRGQAVPVGRGTVAATVNATGNVAPLSQAKLSFRTGGRVESVLVKPGDSVTRGQPLIRVETTDLELALKNAELNLRSAETRLEQIKSGGRPEEVASARAALSSAQAKLGALVGGPNAADVQSAQSAVVSARSSLEKARNDLTKLTTPLTPEELAQTASAVDRARGALVKAQSDYDKVAWQGSIGARPESQALAAATADHQAALASHSLKLQGPKSEDVDNAKLAVTAAEAALQSAQAKLEQVRAGTAPEDIAAARAAVTQAASSVALKENPYTDTDVAAARIAVDQARLAIETARLNLDNAELRAPFNGTVNAVNVNVAEWATTGGNGSVVLVDPTTIRVDTTVDESDIGRLQVGQRAQVRFEALSDRTFNGSVVALSPSASIQQGVATYLVTLSVENPRGVLPGMTASANIVYDEKREVLVVPNRAIRNVGRSRMVDLLLPDGTTREQTVRAGASNDQLTEIVDGLREGDQVVIRSTTTRPSGLPGGVAVPKVIAGR